MVLPAEKAAVIAKIGIGKRSAFDLLQDVEGATAYGVCGDGSSGGGGGMGYYDGSGDGGVAQQTDTTTGTITTDSTTPSRLPSSLSLRRCSHFGDTMHFIDRLTQISLDLRTIPTLKRYSYLVENLSELNRRLRRRMITRGDVSLDVEDGRRGPYEWPTLEDIGMEMLGYSVHLPLEPRVRPFMCVCLCACVYR